MNSLTVEALAKEIYRIKDGAEPDALGFAQSLLTFVERHIAAGQKSAGITAEWVKGYLASDTAPENLQAIEDAFGEWAALHPAITAKPAQAVPLPEVRHRIIQWPMPKTLPRPKGEVLPAQYFDGYSRKELIAYGDAREAAAQYHVNLLGQAITDAAHKAGITRADAVIDGPMLLMLCEDLAEAAGRADAVPEKRWPFVESPGHFTHRLAEAMRNFPLLGAVRHVMIENPPTFAPAPQQMTTQGEAVAWQATYRYPLPNGGFAEWKQITKAEFEDPAALPAHNKRALYALTGSQP